MKEQSENQRRGQWATRLGFVLAATGSAVGLGNIWKFPYIVGEYGGGLFVLIYLLCIAVIGFPVMVAEVVIGRRAQRSPIGAFMLIRGEATAWRVVGWMSVVSGFVILSYYSVVAGWTMNYALMAITRFFDGKSQEQIRQAFATLHGSGDINLFWHFIFMLTTVGIVYGGVQKGIEAWSRFLMPALFALLLLLMVNAALRPGFFAAAAFLFAPDASKLQPAAVLEAMGQSFFTLSLGMGAMLTYGSYLPKKSDIVSSSGLICALDTFVALVACMVVFPIILSVGMAPEAGPGLVFKSVPIALTQMRGGMPLTILFFGLLVFAALTSAISLLEVVTASVIDQLGWSRRRASLVMGSLIFLLGIPSALAGSGKIFANWAFLFGKDFFDTMDYLGSNWLLPLGGLFIAIFVGWVMPEHARSDEFKTGSRFGMLYPAWKWVLRLVVPAAILVLWLFSVEILPKAWLAASP